MSIINEAWRSSINVAESFPSSVAPVITMNRPTNVETEFFYNFFEPDEEISYVPGWQHVDPVDTNIKFGQRARFVKLTWTAPEMVPLVVDPNQPTRFTGESLDTLSIPGFPVGDASLNLENFVMNNLGLINGGASLEGTVFTGVIFQDEDLDGKMFSLLSGSFIQKSANAANTSTNLAPNLSGETSYSLFDAAVSLVNSNDTTEANANILVQALTSYTSFAESVSGQLLDETGRLQTMKRTFDEARNLSIPAQINSKFVKSVMRTSVNDPLGLFSQEFSGMVAGPDGFYHRKQKEAITAAAANPFSITNDDWSFEYLSHSQLIAQIDNGDPDTLVNYHYIKLGYLISRVEYSMNATTGKHEIVNPDTQPYHFYVEPSKDFYDDTEVIFGNVYQYSLQQLALVFLPTFQADSEGNGNIETICQAGTIISSAPARTDYIDAVDKTPPPPPTDFQLDWDYTYNALRITWSLPVTTKKNIVKFQIFRRASIWDPLVLIKEYDFDPRTWRHMTSNQFFAENPMLGVVQKPPYPPQIFFDADFRQSSQATYTMCCVSAAGVSSPLTPQFEVHFDQKENKLVRRMISASGAAKSMPNQLIENEVFVDSMMTSGFSQVRLFFDPEYLVLKDNSTLEGKSLRLLAYNRHGGAQSDSDYTRKYRMNFYNADLQKSRPVDIILLDRTQVGAAFYLPEREDQDNPDEDSRLLFD